MPDLSSPVDIRVFVTAFYGKLLADPEMAPLFLEVAGVDLDQHLPLICSYWEKLLFGHRDYQRHTMNIHRTVHSQQAFTAANFDRWLTFFTSTMAELYAGPVADRAIAIARRIASNMQASLITSPCA